MKIKRRFGAAVAILLAAVLLFSSLPFAAYAAEADAQAGAPAGQSVGKSIDVTTPEQLKAALETDSPDEIIDIYLKNDIIGYNTGTAGNNSEKSYVKTWCKIGKGSKILRLGKCKLEFENDYVAPVAHPDYNYEELEAVNTLTLFSVPEGAELTVEAHGLAGRIRYNGKLLKDHDGIDNRDIFHVDGGKLTVNDGEYSTELRNRVYDYSNGMRQRLQVNCTPVTVNSGVAVINGGYFEAKGFNKYLQKLMPSSELSKAQNAALDVKGGMAIINGDSFYGDNKANALRGDSNNLYVNAGKFGVESLDNKYSTEKGLKYCFWGFDGSIGIPSNGMPPYKNIWIDDTVVTEDFFKNSNGDPYPDKLKYYEAERLWIEPISANPTVSDPVLPTTPVKPVKFYAVSGNIQKYNPEDRLTWNPGENFKLCVDPTSLNFFGRNTYRNQITGSYFSSDNLPATIHVDVTVKNHISDSYQPVIATLNYGNITKPADGMFTIYLNLLMNMDVNGTALKDMLNVGQNIDLDFAITETFISTRGGDGSVNYNIDHKASMNLTVGKPRYKVSFEANGGDGKRMDDIYVTEGEMLTLPECTYKYPNDEKIFGTWDTENKDGSIEAIAAGKSTMITKNTVFKAGWVSNTYTVSFRGNGGPTYMKDVQVKRGGLYKMPYCTLTPKNEDEEFDEWFLASPAQATPVTKKPGDVVTVDSNMEWVARWTTNTTTLVTLYANLEMPKAGETYDNEKEVTTPLSNRYIANIQRPYVYDSNGNRRYMEDGETFEPGVIYGLQFYFNILDNNQISSVVADTHYIVNGQAATLTHYDSRTPEVELKYQIPATLDYAEASIQAPRQAGDQPSYKATVPDGSYYEVLTDYNSDDENLRVYDGISWYNVTDGVYMEKYGHFELNKTYKARVYLKPSGNNKWAKDIETDPNVNSAEAHVKSDTVAYIEYTFDVVTKYNIWLGDTQVTSLNMDDIFDDGTAKLEFQNGTAYLTLDNPDIMGYHRGYLSGESGEMRNCKIYSFGYHLVIKGSYSYTKLDDDADENGIVYAVNSNGFTGGSGSLALFGEFNFPESFCEAQNYIYLVEGSLEAKALLVEKSNSFDENDKGVIALGKDAHYLKTMVINSEYINITPDKDCELSVVSPAGGELTGGKVCDMNGEPYNDTFTLSSPPKKVTSVNITVPEPKAGEAPSYEAVFDEVGYEISQYSIDWIDLDTQQPMEQGEVFKKDGKYYILMAVYLNDGMIFADEFSITVNGKSATCTYDGGSPSMSFFVEYDLSGGENPTQPLPPAEITDTETGIVVRIESAESDIRLIVDKNDEPEPGAFQVEGTISAVYNISLEKDGEEVQPNAPVTVKIPCDDPDAKVYRVEDDDSLTDMNAVYEDGCLVFTTEHFSDYLVVLPDKDDIMIGDVTGDGRVTIDDATDIQKALAHRITLTAEQEKAADANGDGRLSIDDATTIQKYLAKMIDKLGK